MAERLGRSSARIPVAASTTGATTLVAAVTGQKLRVLAAILHANGAVNVNLQAHTNTGTKTGLFYFAAAGGNLVLPFNPEGWFDTPNGDALDINLSGNVAVGGQLVYVVE